MKSIELSVYLQSHAPLESFYLFMPREGGEVLIKYLDAAGKSWNLMEDDDKIVSKASEFLRQSGSQVFNDYTALLKFEEQAGKNSY